MQYSDTDLLAQVRERSLAQRSVAFYRGFQQHVDAAQTDWRREMLDTIMRHWWSEIIGDLEMTMGTLVPEPYYCFHGSNAFGTVSEVVYWDDPTEVFPAQRPG